MHQNSNCNGIYDFSYFLVSSSLVRKHPTYSGQYIFLYRTLVTCPFLLMVSYCYPPHPLIALIGLCTNFWEGICISSDVIRIHVYINGLSSPRSAWAMETQTRDSMSKVVWEMTIICSLSCIFFLWNILFWRLRVSKVWRFSVVSCLVLIHSTQVSLRDMMGLTNHLEMEVVSWYIFAAYNVDFVVFPPSFTLLSVGNFPSWIW